MHNDHRSHSKSKDLTPVKRADLRLGKALGFPLYDRDGKLLLAVGTPITSEKQLEYLARHAVARTQKWDEFSAFRVESMQPSGFVSNSYKVKVSPFSFGKSTLAPSKDIAEPKQALASPEPVALKANPPQVAKAAKQREPVEQLLAIHRKRAKQEPSETGAVLKMNLVGESEFFLTQLIGTVSKQSFLITHPTLQGLLIPIEKGQRWEFRTFYGCAVYRFTAEVIKTIDDARPLIMMSWPEGQKLESKTIRSARRISCEVAATVGVKEAGVLLPGLITNLSTGGAEICILGDRVIRDQQMIDVDFQLPISGKETPMKLKAKVVDHRDDLGGGFTCGLSFPDLPERDYLALHAFVCESLVQRFEPRLYSQRS